MRRIRRWVVVAIAGGSLTPGVGCQVAESSTWSMPHSITETYPGLLPRASEDSRVIPIRHAEPVSVDPPPEKIASAPATTSEETLDLEIALRLAGVDNPTIAIAREQIREALAVQLASRSLLLPSVNIGGNYHKHTGALQASFGGIRIVDSQSLYLGFGARTLAAESVAYPGIRLFAHLGDAAYEPLAARQLVASRQSDAQAVQNDILLRVATAYLELIGAESRLGVLKQGEVDVSEIARLTRVYAEKGQGRQSDANRSASHVELLREEIQRAEGDVAVASARLCRLLSLDPSLKLQTPGGAVLPFRLIPEDSETETLVAEAMESRPELFARRADIQQAQVRVRQERVRPFLPLVSVGFSSGLFGGGSNQVTSQFGPMNGRTDFDAFAVWNIQNLGFGNRAQVRRTNAVVSETVSDYDRVLNLVRREVAESLADAQSAARQMDVAKLSLASAEDGYKLEMKRILQNGPGRPIEVLDSFQQLLDARQELLRAVTAFNIAQFRLFVAIGSSPLSRKP